MSIESPQANEMITTFDDLFKNGGVYFLPWIGDNYSQGFCGRKFLVVGESHYSHWVDADGTDRYHPPSENWTREFISGVTAREGCARFWKNVEQALLNEERVDSGNGKWYPNGGLALWNRFAFYNFVQSALERPGILTRNGLKRKRQARMCRQ